MPHPRLRHLALLVAVIISAACASTSQGGTSKPEKITPPQQLRGGPPPEIREVVDIRYEVLVNADGQPDLRTLKVTGEAPVRTDGPREGQPPDRYRSSGA